MSAAVEVRLEAVEQLRLEISRLESPWIADEGPTDCGFRQGLGEDGLRLRGIAFDDATTVVWDEEGVQCISEKGHDVDTIMLKSEVLVRQRTGWPLRLLRIDYLREGALIASRYQCLGSGKGGERA